MPTYLAALLELLEDMELLTTHARVLLEGVEAHILEAANEALKNLPL